MPKWHVCGGGIFCHSSDPMWIVREDHLGGFLKMTNFRTKGPLRKELSVECKAFSHGVGFSMLAPPDERKQSQGKLRTNSQQWTRSVLVSVL